MWWYKQNVKEEIITTGTGEHTNIFHLLLSLPLLYSDFLLYPQGYKFKRAENQHSLSCSEKQTVLCHWNALYFFFFFLLESRHTHLLVASHWHTLNAQSKVLPWCRCAGFCRGRVCSCWAISLFVPPSLLHVPAWLSQTSQLQLHKHSHFSFSLLH